MDVSPTLMAHALATTVFKIAVIGAVILAAIAAAVMALTPFDGGFVASALTLYVVCATLVVTRVGALHNHAYFGAANIMTLARLILVCLLAGLAFEITVFAVPVSMTVSWWFFAIAVLGVVLDALDGPVARRKGQVSDFGSRFDMEVDALQIMALSFVAFGLGKAGLWVVLSGLLRYLFVGAALIWRFMAGTLRFSRRRRVISGIQSTVLALLLAPVLVPPLSSIAAAAALGLLIYSFTVDTLWLAQQDKT